MESKLTNFSQTKYLYFFVIGSFFIITSNHLLSKGMFMDGLFYATISRNISVGDGSLWHLKFTNTLLKNFHEHPPLAMWLQSFYFDCFGNNMIVDKLYSLSTYFFSAVVIHKSWKLLFPKSELSWIVLFFWLFTPVVSWSVSNNMLENTLTIFILLSFYFSMKYILCFNLYFVFLSGFFIFLGFLTKGFVALFPLSIFFIYFLFYKEFSFKRFVVASFSVVAAVIVPMTILLVFINDAFESIRSYIEVQVINSLNNIVTVDSRFFIIKRLFSELLVMLVFLLLIYLFTKKFNVNFISKNVKFFIFLFSFALTGVLPILVSLKQSGYYILTVYPIFAIGFVTLFNNHLLILHNYLKINVLTKYISVLILAIGIFLIFFNLNSYSRDEQIIKDITKINSVVKKGEIVCGTSDLATQYSILGYFYRMNFVSVSFETECKRRYLISFNNSIYDKQLNYRKLSIGTKEILIYERIKQ
jgi:4-amino-4-deoxy-L-arabinose transferase-like glycosyltransferase